MQKEKMLFHKKKILRKMFLPVLVLSTIPSTLIISCSSSIHIGFKDFVANYDQKKLIRDAEILTWFDGDTPRVKIKDPQTNAFSETSIRLMSIDTPEYHDPNASDKEKRGNIGDYELMWAKKATEWAKKELPVGSKVKIYSDGTKSYNRLVGSIFYNKKGNTGFNENYSVNIIKAGFSFPLVSDDQVFDGFMNDLNIYHYLSIPLYYAWEEAKKNKVELFGLSQDNLTKAYLQHGIPEKGNKGLDEVPSWINDWIKKPSFSKYNIIY